MDILKESSLPSSPPQPTVVRSRSPTPSNSPTPRSQVSSVPSELRAPRGTGLFSPLGAEPTPLPRPHGRRSGGTSPISVPDKKRGASTKAATGRKVVVAPSLQDRPDAFRRARSAPGRSMRTLIRFGNASLAGLIIITTVVSLLFHTSFSFPLTHLQMELIMVAIYVILMASHIGLHELALVYSTFPTQTGCTNWNDIAKSLALYCAFLHHPVGKAVYIFLISSLMIGLELWWFLYIIITLCWAWSCMLVVLFIVSPRRIRAMDVREALPVVSVLYLRYLDETKIVGKLSPHNYSSSNHSSSSTHDQYCISNEICAPTKISHFKSSAGHYKSSASSVVDATTWFSANPMNFIKTKDKQPKRLRVEGRHKKPKVEGRR